MPNTQTTPPRLKAHLVAFVLALLLLFALPACGDYKPCKELALRICNECPHVDESWQAACLCIEFGSLKEKGYRCIDPNEEDRVRCNATLEQWDENTCDLLN